MKFLFTGGGSAATVFGMAPLATAARTAGHEILLTVDEPLLAAAESIGLPAVVTPHPGMPAERLDALIELSRVWPADVVVGGLSHIPGLLAAHLGARYVRHYWDIVPLRPEPGLPELLGRAGLAAPPEADLFVDVCPPFLRPSPTPGATPMRWVPLNGQRRLEPWMYTRPEGRRRVLLTSGSRIPLLRTAGSAFRQLVDTLLREGAEVIVAAPEGAAAEFGAVPEGMRIGWFPLDVLAPTLDVAVHHGGAATVMTLLNAGAPQVITPEVGYSRAVAAAVAGSGAALTVLPEERPGEDPAAPIAAACARILADPGYAERAASVAAELATLPTPAEVVATLEKIPARSISMQRA